MSFINGLLAGSLLAGGIYYSFSYGIRNGTLEYKRQLHTLSERMVNPNSGVKIPAPAAERIVPEPFSSLVKQKWNEHTQAIFQWSNRPKP